MTTLETITIRQIEDLRAEGRRIHDKEMVIFCNKALQRSEENLAKCVTIIQHREAGDFVREYEEPLPDLTSELLKHHKTVKINVRMAKAVYKARTILETYISTVVVLDDNTRDSLQSLKDELNEVFEELLGQS